MLLAITTGKRKNAMTDSYKNILNEFIQKNQTYIVIPSAYDQEEFSDKFKFKIKETFSCNNKIIALFQSMSFAYKLRKIVKQNGIIRIFLYFDNDWFNIILNIFLINTKVDYFVWIHDPILHSGEGIITKTVRLFNEKFLYRKAKKIFISWEGIKGVVADRYKIGQEKIVSIKLPEMAETQFSDIIPSDSDKCLYDILFFGRIESYKGINLLIDTILYLEQSGRLLRTVIGGTGSIEKEVAKSINGHSNIIFINKYIENRKLAELISVSKIVVLPYKDATGTLAIQTANFYNKPVIASNVGCFSEYIENGVNGFIFDQYTVDDLANKIFYLLENRSLYQKMQQKMPYYFKKNFNLKTMAHKLEKEIQI